MNRLAVMLTVLALPAWPKSAMSEPPAPRNIRVASSQQAADAIADDIIGGLWRLTDAHFHKGEYNHIINLCKMIIAARPDLLDAYADAAWLLWSMDRDDEAVALYKAGLRANPHTSYMYDELGTYYLMRKKDYRQAIHYYEEARRFKDYHPFMLHSLAHAYEKSGDLPKALAVWQEAARNPKDVAAKVNIERLKRLMAQPQPNH
ncbi:MAG: tetratricopeptide repeat protein [Chthonomonadales bacterium]